MVAQPVGIQLVRSPQLSRPLENSVANRDETCETCSRAQNGRATAPIQSKSAHAAALQGSLAMPAPSFQPAAVRQSWPQRSQSFAAPQVMRTPTFDWSNCGPQPMYPQSHHPQVLSAPASFHLSEGDHMNWGSNQAWRAHAQTPNVGPIVRQATVLRSTLGERRPLTEARIKPSC